MAHHTTLVMREMNTFDYYYETVLQYIFEDEEALRKRMEGGDKFVLVSATLPDILSYGRSRNTSAEEDSRGRRHANMLLLTVRQGRIVCSAVEYITSHAKNSAEPHSIFDPGLSVVHRSYEDTSWDIYQPTTTREADEPIDIRPEFVSRDEVVYVYFGRAGCGHSALALQRSGKVVASASDEGSDRPLSFYQEQATGDDAAYQEGAASWPITVGNHGLASNPSVGSSDLKRVREMADTWEDQRPAQRRRLNEDVSDRQEAGCSEALGATLAVTPFSQGSNCDGRPPAEREERWQEGSVSPRGSRCGDNSA